MKPFFKMFFEKNDYRKIMIFLKLQKLEEKKFELLDVLNLSNTSKKTSYADFYELRQDLINVYGSPIFIEDEQKKFIFIQNSCFLNQELMVYYLRKARNFWLFNQIVQNTPQSVNDLKKNLFFSQSVVYRSLEKLNRTTCALSITLSMAGIQGDERMVRKFLVEVYWAFYGGYHWPFNIDKRILIGSINNFDIVSENDNEIEKEKILYWLAITKIRIEKGETIPAKLKIKESKYKYIFKSILTSYGLEMNNDVLLNSEFNFFTKMVNTVVQDVIPMSIGKKETLSEYKIESVENYLIQKGKKELQNKQAFESFCGRISQINSFVDSEIVDWYHFVETEALSSYRNYFFLLKDQEKKILKHLPEKIASAYVFECNKVHLYLVRPLYIKIHSKENNSTEVVLRFKKYSPYPVQINNEIRYADIILSNIIKDKKNKENNSLYFYEWPLTKNRVEFIVNHIINKKKCLNSLN